MIFLKKNNIMILSFIFSILFVSGCSKSSPKCSDTETTNTVKQIVKNKFAEFYEQKAVDEIGNGISIDGIRTTNTNGKTGAQECAAQLTFKGPNGQMSYNITYKSELTDKGDEFYVTVFGLPF